MEHDAELSDAERSFAIHLLDAFPYNLYTLREFALGGHAEAAAIMASRFLKQNEQEATGANYYNSACVFAICSRPVQSPGSHVDTAVLPSALVSQSAKTESHASPEIEESNASEDLAELQEQWTSRAFKCLQNAKDAGYFKDASHIVWMDKDPDLSSIRELPNYRSFISELRDAKATMSHIHSGKE